MPKKKYSLKDFKNKLSSNESRDNIALISGGILGSCHCVTSLDEPDWQVVYCVYYQQ